MFQEVHNILALLQNTMTPVHPVQFANRPNSHVNMRKLFMDYSSSFTCIVPSKLISRLRDLGLHTSTLWMDSEHPDVQTSGCDDRHHRILHPRLRQLLTPSSIFLTVDPVQLPQGSHLAVPDLDSCHHTNTVTKREISSSSTADWGGATWTSGYSATSCSRTIDYANGTLRPSMSDALQPHWHGSSWGPQWIHNFTVHDTEDRSWWITSGPLSIRNTIYIYIYIYMEVISRRRVATVNETAAKPETTVPHSASTFVGIFF